MVTPYELLSQMTKEEQRIYVEKYSAFDELVEMLLDLDYPPTAVINYFGETDPLAKILEQTLLETELVRSMSIRAKQAAEDSILEALQFSKQAESLQAIDLDRVVQQVVASLTSIDATELVSRSGK